MPYKDILSGFAIALTFAAFFPYIRAIKQGKTKPHVFSWIIWGAATLVIFLAQLSDGGGADAWPIGVSGLITIYIAVLAWQCKADTTFTNSDRFFLAAAMLSLPLWYVTANPLWAVVILTTVDVLGFGPTVRKAYLFPHDEHLGFFLIVALRNLVSIAALEHYSLITLLFPAVTAVVCLAFVVMVAFRRRRFLRPRPES